MVELAFACELEHMDGLPLSCKKTAPFWPLGSDRHLGVKSGTGDNMYRPFGYSVETAVRRR
jgi:hypothetical protein